MHDTERPTAEGKVLWQFTMSLDGFVAGPNHGMGWMTGCSVRPGLVDEYGETTGAILAGRAGWDVDREGWDHGHRPYGGAWAGPIFILTHHPEDAAPADGVTFLDCDVSEAVQIGLEAAGGENLEVFSPTIGRQLLERGLIDEVDLPYCACAVGGRNPSVRQPGRRADPPGLGQRLGSHRGGECAIPPDGSRAAR